MNQRKAAIVTFNSDNQARGLLAHFLPPPQPPAHDFLLLGGGVNSGKTFLFGASLDFRAKRETGIIGALFVNSLTTFRTGIYNEVCRLFCKRLGREAPTHNRQPPIAWQRRWIQEKKEIPQLPSYTGVMCTPDGIHVAVGSLHNEASVHQFETVQYGWAWIEEAINNTQTANDTVRERVRCALGGQNNPDCALYHHHTTTWVFNPPGPHPYLYKVLDDQEAAAIPYYHALRDGETCDGCWYEEDGDSYPRHHGPLVNHREWPLLRRGIGRAIWIKSRTSDNTENQDKGYRNRLAKNMSRQTALRRLEGEIFRETEGRCYQDFSDANIRPVRYDPDRTLFFSLDFNIKPRAAIFAQLLVSGQGEVDSQYDVTGVQHVGVFGEYFLAGEMDDRHFAKELVRGGRGSGGNSQPEYASEVWRGLPPSCDDDCEERCSLGHWNGLAKHRGSIVAFGDQRATARNSAIEGNGSSWDIVGKIFGKLPNYGRSVPEEQPSPRARVDLVNAKFLNELGIRTLWVDPRCEELIRDLELVLWDDDGQSEREWRRGSAGTEWHRTHLVQALGYFIYQYFGGREDGGGMADIEVQLESKSKRHRGKHKYPMSR